MKALSVRQPWASLIVWGLKTVEVRSWQPSYRGCLLIHAAKTQDETALARMGLERAPTGAVIGVVALTGVEALTVTSWNRLASEHLDVGAFQPNLFAWHLESPRALEHPVPCRGDRGLFEVRLSSEELERICPARQEPWAN
jgi:predicted transcriptional regulator